MQAFRLQNFRGFRDTGWIQLKPLTLLVGANSTGKSSLLRFLPLLRQSMATQTGVPFAWAKEGGVDMGTAQDVHRRGATEPMRVGIQKRVKQPWLNNSADPQTPTDMFKSVAVELELAVGSETAVGEAKELSIRAGEFSTRTFVLSKSRSTEGIYRTGDEWLTGLGFNEGVVPLAFQPNSHVQAELHQLIFSTVGANRDEFTDEDDYSYQPISSRYSWLSTALHLSPKEFRHIIETQILRGERIGLGDEQLLAVQQRLWRITVGDLLFNVQRTLMPWTQSIEYIGPARFPPMRYHRMWAERPRRLMPDGANLAVLFGGMGARDQREFNSFLMDALGYTLSLKSGTGNAELTLTNAEGETFNIADLGFGLSQVLPVYLQAHLAQQNPSLSRTAASLFVVEQPELHLHPQLQAKLADLFVGMSARSEHNAHPVPCFVETHSKALLERTGELVEEGAIPAEDVQVLLFEKDGKDCTVRTTTFDEHGVLRDWPVGFLSR